MPQVEPGGVARPHILIVDDLPANLGVLLGVLDGAGYQILVATSGEGALARLAYVQPDLILLDVNMPGLNGYETCRRLKAEARWRDVPVLFLTAQDDPEDKLEGFKAGGVDYITKPLHAGEVLARVRTHLQIRSLQQALTEKNELLETAISQRLQAEAQLQQSLDRAVLVVDSEGRNRVLHASGTAALGTILSRRSEQEFTTPATEFLAVYRCLSESMGA